MKTDLIKVQPFSAFELGENIERALEKLKYITPSPIQALMIPAMLAGADVVAQAQTGTGKTAAFALPILAQLNLALQAPQALILAPTRELALQVANEFKQYAQFYNKFRVLPIYGGQPYTTQLKALKQGIHVAVGTPGRIMDHLRRGTLSLASLKWLVLDEADEMLRMGFIDDVSWILEQITQPHQKALLSATLPAPIRRVAKKYLNQPQELTVNAKTLTADLIRQRYWVGDQQNKLNALKRLLESEVYNAIIVFVRTKKETFDLSEQLSHEGYACSALNGDVPQNNREQLVRRFKSGSINILIATDVAARGLDVDRISHVINYDLPFDVEAYTHRIGRTGRAGRQGEAILFITPREKRFLREIESITKCTLEPFTLPSADWLSNQRITQFKEKITNIVDNKDLKDCEALVQAYHAEKNINLSTIAAALVELVHKDKPLWVSELPKPVLDFTKQKSKNKRAIFDNSKEKVQFRIEVGAMHGAKPSQIVGAIANEGGINGRNIGAIQIREHYSFVELPDLSKQIFEKLRQVRVSGQLLKLARVHGSASLENKKYKKKKRSASSFK
ncbi:MAG: DEAD/DEAH box helicase [Endozoicomonadaceae bacterium]|nr:DEAD/DEAH box helicase [Endozoicomonadaceae bacterium]